VELTMMINITYDVPSRVSYKFTNVPEELAAPIFMVLSSTLQDGGSGLVRND